MFFRRRRGRRRRRRRRLDKRCTCTSTTTTTATTATTTTFYVFECGSGVRWNGCDAFARVDVNVVSFLGVIGMGDAVACVLVNNGSDVAGKKTGVESGIIGESSEGE